MSEIVGAASGYEGITSKQLDTIVRTLNTDSKYNISALDFKEGDVELILSVPRNWILEVNFNIKNNGKEINLREIYVLDSNNNVKADLIEYDDVSDLIGKILKLELMEEQTEEKPAATKTEKIGASPQEIADLVIKALKPELDPYKIECAKLTGVCSVEVACALIDCKRDHLTKHREEWGLEFNQVSPKKTVYSYESVVNFRKSLI